MRELARRLGARDELVEVLPAEQRWRGAIERALGGERLRLLGPPAAFAQALHWVNNLHNRGVRVLLLDPKAARWPKRASAAARASTMATSPSCG